MLLNELSDREMIMYRIGLFADIILPVYMVIELIMEYKFGVILPKTARIACLGLNVLGLLTTTVLDFICRYRRKKAHT